MNTATAHVIVNTGHPRWPCTCGVRRCQVAVRSTVCRTLLTCRVSLVLSRASRVSRSHTVEIRENRSTDYGAASSTGASGDDSAPFVAGVGARGVAGTAAAVCETSSGRAGGGSRQKLYELKSSATSSSSSGSSGGKIWSKRPSSLG